MTGTCPKCGRTSARAPTWPFCSNDCRGVSPLKSKPRLKAGRDPEEIRAETIEENQRLNRMLGNSLSEGVRPIPPDGPIENEKHYETLLWRRLPHLHRQDQNRVDLNNVPIPKRISQIETFMLLYDAKMPLGMLVRYEDNIRLLKKLLRSTWGGSVEPYQKAQAQLLKLKARVTRIYKARRWNRP